MDLLKYIAIAIVAMLVLFAGCALWLRWDRGRRYVDFDERQAQARSKANSAAGFATAVYVVIVAIVFPEDRVLLQNLLYGAIFLFAAVAATCSILTDAYVRLRDSAVMTGVPLVLVGCFYLFSCQVTLNRARKFSDSMGYLWEPERYMDWLDLMAGILWLYLGILLLLHHWLQCRGERDE